MASLEVKDTLDFEDLRRYFTKTQWSELKDMEKIRYSNMKSNHLFKLSIGLKSQPPDFMRRRNKSAPLLTSSLQLTSSSEEEDEKEEDEEWTPSVSGRQKTLSVPPSDRELRQLPRIDYTEEEEPEDEEYFYCDECKEFFLWYCEEHGPPVFRIGRTIPLGVPDRARKTLPKRFQIKRSRIPNAGLGVFYKGKFPLDVGTHFGPYQGVKTSKEEAEESGYSWVIRKKKKYIYIDAKDETKSNWMRYVNCARFEEEQNLIAFQFRQAVVYRVCRPIRKGEELLVWYGDDYAKELGIIFDKMWDHKSSNKGPGPQTSKTQTKPSQSQTQSSPQTQTKASKAQSSQSQTQTQAFCCPGCPYAFTSQLFLYKHLKRSHNELYFQMLRSGQIPPAAAACQQQQQSSETNLKPGDTGHSGAGLQGGTSATCEKVSLEPCSGGKAFHCKQCGKSFKCLSELEAHERVHTGERPFQCEQCEKSFSQAGTLKNHQIVHTGETPYHCNLCEKSFNRVGNLKTHQRLHTGQKPFHCQQCGLSFRHSDTLKRHQRTHTGEKPYHCKQCGKSFALLGGLKRHKCVHTGEKSFPCRQCGKSFKRSAHLKKHQCVSALC